MTDTVITPLRRRRTYLDACREQKVYQDAEEARAELADIEARRARRRGEEAASLAAFRVAALVHYREDAPGRLADAINHLGNNSAASAPQKVAVISTGIGAILVGIAPRRRSFAT